MYIHRFENQINKLSAAIAKGLPGAVAHNGMAPANRNQLVKNSKGPEFARKSSVLIILFPDEKGEINTAFIKRVEYDGVHSGQVAFPGGRFEETDIDLIATALREAEEEVGVNAASVTVIGKLSDLFVPPSNFIISPIVAKCLSRPEFIPDGTEVAEVFTVPLKHFLNPQFTGEYDVTYKSGEVIRIPGYYFNQYLIWGATAMILNELLQLAKDAGVIKPE